MTIKVILTGLIDCDHGGVNEAPQFSLDEACFIVAEAHRLGRSTFAHCSGLAGLEIAIEAGIGPIQHGFFMTRPLLERMAEKQIAWPPTFCPVWFQFAHPEVVGWTSETVQNMAVILESHACMVGEAVKLGVPVLLGTDAGRQFVEHGVALYSEIERNVAAGLDMKSVLRAATSAPRRHFGMKHVSLFKGAPFEACLWRDSPFQVAEALRQPLRVWRA